MRFVAYRFETLNSTISRPAVLPPRLCKLDRGEFAAHGAPPLSAFAMHLRTSSGGLSGHAVRYQLIAIAASLSLGSSIARLKVRRQTSEPSVCRRRKISHTPSS